MGTVWVTGRLLLVVHGYTAWTGFFRMEGFHRMRTTESFQKKKRGGKALRRFSGWFTNRAVPLGTRASFGEACHQPRGDRCYPHLREPPSPFQCTELMYSSTIAQAPISRCVVSSESLLSGGKFLHQTTFSEGRFARNLAPRRQFCALLTHHRTEHGRGDFPTESRPPPTIR